MILHTVWMYWPSDDAIELAGAIDDLTFEANPDAYVHLYESACNRVGTADVREIKVDVDWNAVCLAFEPPKIEGQVKA
jgi:hypothetical protein